MVISDGVTPSNEGRGYVLRRILRRAIRSIRLLGWHEGPALPICCRSPGTAWRRPTRRSPTDFDRISTYAYGEEEAFLSTLRAGTTILDTGGRGDEEGAAKSALSGDKAFQLHDTYGFPIDLTLEIAAEQGLAVDEDGFRRLMAEQRTRAKADAEARKTGHADLSRSAPRSSRAGRSSSPATARSPASRGARRCSAPPAGDPGGRRGLAGARRDPVLRRGRRAAARPGRHHRRRRQGRGPRRAARRCRA